VAAHTIGNRYARASVVSLHSHVHNAATTMEGMWANIIKVSHNI
jgi:hypothetical protein